MPNREQRRHPNIPPDRELKLWLWLHSGGRYSKREEFSRLRQIYPKKWKRTQ